MVRVRVRVRVMVKVRVKVSFRVQKYLGFDQKIMVPAKVIAFSNLKFTGYDIYTTRANFNRNLWKTKNLATKKLTSPSFLR